MPTSLHAYTSPTLLYLHVTTPTACLQSYSSGAPTVPISSPPYLDDCNLPLHLRVITPKVSPEVHISTCPRLRPRIIACSTLPEPHSSISVYFHIFTSQARSIPPQLQISKFPYLHIGKLTTYFQSFIPLQLLSRPWGIDTTLSNVSRLPACLLSFRTPYLHTTTSAWLRHASKAYASSSEHLQFAFIPPYLLIATPTACLDTSIRPYIHTSIRPYIHTSIPFQLHICTLAARLYPQQYSAHTFSISLMVAFLLQSTVLKGLLHTLSLAGFMWCRPWKEELFLIICSKQFRSSTKTIHRM